MSTRPSDSTSKRQRPTAEASTSSITDEQVSLALKLFECAPPVTSEDLEKKYRALQRFWHPHRYANLTNNPRKYMEMFKKAEAKLKEIEAAYEVLRAWVQRQERHAATE